MKSRVLLIQRHLNVTADGLIGPKTIAALMAALNIKEHPEWPTQKEVRSGTSIFGRPGNESNLVSIQPAYPLYYDGQRVRTIRVHKLIADHVSAALAEILEHYGQAEITRLGLDQYGGSYNYRQTSSGSGALSMHAWGIALDFHPDKNPYERRSPYATLSHPECTKFWEIWESHGATSLGRARDFDWMHLQFADL